MKLDSLHYNTRKIDGYNKAFNFIVSEREAGKSTAIILTKLYKQWKENKRPSLIIRRLITDITDIYISDIAKVLNKFEIPLEFEYTKKSLKEGVVDVYVNESLFARFIALSNPLSRIKSLMLPNIAYIIFDEFICNQREGEKYLPNEAFKFCELYNTFQREATGLKCYFMGNPYSLYNPYFIFFGVNTRKVHRGCMQVGVNWALECYEILPELREMILQKNPLYQFDNAYTRYAFNGEAINDANIKLSCLQDNFYLKFCFKLQGKLVGIFQKSYYEDDSDVFFCQFVSNISKRRDIYTFDFGEMVDQTILLSREERFAFSRFKRAFRERKISFSSIEVYYLCEEIYTNI